MTAETILLSPSQINTAKRCLRLWAFSYIDKVKLPSSAGQATGTELHSIGENWLSKSIPPKGHGVGAMFLAGIEHLPVPSEDLLIEHGFVFEDGKLRWRGFIDCVDLGTDPVLMLDHKSTSSFRWIKKPIELLVDTQAIIYGKFLCEKHNLTEVEARWVYYKTKGKPASKKVSVRLSKEAIDFAYLKLNKLGLELLKVKQEYKTGLDIQLEQFPHPGCREFGGCSFYEVCQLKEKGKEEMSDLLSRLRNMSTGDNGQAAPTAAVSIPPDLINPTVTFEEQPTEACDSAVESKDATEVVVPRPKRGRPKKAKAKASTAPAKRKTKPRALEICDEAVAAEEQAISLQKTVPGMTLEEARILVEKHGPGITVGSERETTPAVESAGVAEDSTRSATSEEPGTVFNYNQAEGFTLYVNCMPESGGLSSLDLAMEAAKIAAAENGVEHYRLIEYGGGPAQLCIALEKVISEKGPLRGPVLINTANQVTADAMPVFEALAVGVVRGL